MRSKVTTWTRQAIIQVARRAPLSRSVFRALDELRTSNAVLATERNQAVLAQQAADEARLQTVKEREEAERVCAIAVRDRETAERERANLADEIASLKSASTYQVLEGTPYCRYAIPVDYLPSRDFRPRWGYTHPPEPILDAWFRAHLDQYAAFLNKMRVASRALADIPKQFDESRLPQPAWFGVPYSPFDAVALYTMVRVHRPKIYLEIGSGISTCFAYKAIMDSGLDTEIISIDPEPRAKIDTICNRIERVGLEECDVSLFERLEANDILFFDGSHRSFMNSDVTVFILDVLPRLKPGVIVHVHDIVLPFDYPEMFKTWYWNEQYILAAYLIGHKYRINPMFPTGFVCRENAFASTDFTLVDLGEDNGVWRGGGAMWFTHTAPISRD